MTWQKLDPAQGDPYVVLSADATARLDPYLAWHHLTGFRWTRRDAKFPAVAAPGTDTPDWLPFLIELDPAGASPNADALVKSLAAALGLTAKQVVEMVLLVPPIYFAPLTQSGSPPLFITGNVAAAHVETVMRHVKRMQLGVARAGDEVRVFGQDVPAGQGIGHLKKSLKWFVKAITLRPVVLGVIDDGCNFAHPAYRSANASRVSYVWEQSADAPAWAGKPLLFGYGSVLDPTQIGNFLGERVDEVETYRRTYKVKKPFERHHPSLVKAKGTHGTAAMQLLAGSARPLPQQATQPVLEDAASHSPLVFVQLPKLMLTDTSSSSLCVCALDGLRYIIERADGIFPVGGPSGVAPVVVNLSYSGMAGPHDGSGLLDEAIHELVSKRGNLAVVVASGNNRRNHCHAQLEMPASGAETQVGLQVAPENPLTSTVEVWIPKDGAAQVRLVAPNGATSAWASPGEIHVCDHEGAEAAWVLYPKANALARDRQVALIAIAPSGGRQGARGTAPHGLWKLQVKNTGGAALTVHAWAERNDMANASLRRQQCRLVDLDARVVTTRGTMCSPATSMGAIAVGARVGSTGGPSPYSAEGDPALGKAGPDAWGYADLGLRVRGLRVPAVSSGASVRISGTSAAAPVVARAIANWLAGKTTPQTWADIRAFVSTLG